MIFLKNDDKDDSYSVLRYLSSMGSLSSVLVFISKRNVPKKVRFRGLMIQNLSMLKGMKKKSVLIFKARVKILKKCIKQVYRRNNSTLEMQPYGSITKPICEGH